MIHYRPCGQISCCHDSLKWICSNESLGRELDISGRWRVACESRLLLGHRKRFVNTENTSPLDIIFFFVTESVVYVSCTCRAPVREDEVTFFWALFTPSGYSGKTFSECASWNMDSVLRTFSIVSVDLDYYVWGRESAKTVLTLKTAVIPSFILCCVPGRFLSP